MKSVAETIVDELFQNHFGEQATRLEMKQAMGQHGERALGGWCRESVIEIIDKHLPVTLKRIRAARTIREGKVNPHE